MKEMKQWVMLLVLGTGMSFGFSACSDDENLPDNGGEEPTESTTTGVYILNSGRMSSNNSTLDYYDPLTQELTGDVFAAVSTLVSLVSALVSLVSRPLGSMTPFQFFNLFTSFYSAGVSPSVSAFFFSSSFLKIYPSTVFTKVSAFSS